MGKLRVTFRDVGRLRDIYIYIYLLFGNPAGYLLNVKVVYVPQEHRHIIASYQLCLDRSGVLLVLC
jgi:hypothetical protein